MPSPNLSAFLAYCRTCETQRDISVREEKDATTGEVYYDLVCPVCFSVFATLTPKQPEVRPAEIAEEPRGSEN
ncbi:MAG TPA: hypothetical protein VN633_17030 [Bryobacteraceae bacterium]|nr:hypothetical protein [Bryobacteraceae bacterium]